LISAIGSTVNGKRAAVIHLLFNTFGVLIFFIILTCWPDFMNTTLAVWFAGHPATQIAMFHTLFNVICTLLFEPFIKFFVKLAELIIPEKKTAQPAELDLLDARFLKNPGIALNQAIMYYHLMAKTALEDLNLSIEAFAAKDKTKRSEIDQIENKVLAMSKNLTSFIVQISSAGIGEQGNLRISKMQLDIADIVRLTEVADNMTGYTIHEVDENLVFSDIVFVQLDQMKKMLNEQFAQADQIVDKPSLALLEKTRQMEDAIDAQRTMMISGHMARLAAGECHPSSSGVFINLVGNLERCGDHLNFISERACQELLQKEAKKNQQEILPPHP
jgi:phosphate:Na+ symporter